jgi:hypothetical protein
MGLLSKAAVKTAASGLSAEDAEDIQQKLENHFRRNPSMRAVVFDIPPGFAAEDGEKFDAMVNRVITLLGSVLALPSGRVLAIFSETVDRELVARQLEKTLNTKALVLFCAEAPAKALEYIGPYL